MGVRVRAAQGQAQPVGPVGRRRGADPRAAEDGARARGDVAHGVGQAEQLRAMGCDEVQGYLYAKPLPAADLVRWLAGRPGST